MKYDCLIIDYGHGGMIDGVYQTPGGKQYHHTDVTPTLSLYEGVSNRMTALELARLALAAGVRVWDCVADRWLELPLGCSRCDLEQTDVPLSARVRSANKHPGGLLISCHSNAVGNSIRGPSLPANGVDIYTSRGNTRADAVADTVFRSFGEHLAGLRLRGGEYSDGDSDHEADFYVLRKTSMPAVLGEVGFFTNLGDAQFLAEPENHFWIGQAYWMGVREWLL